MLHPGSVDQVIHRYDNSTGPMVGARAVARAWRDDAYRTRLLENSPAALADLGLNLDRLLVVENTAAVHNMVVCTLCSCYPWDVLGLPPTWYKAPAYRSRVVSEPRKVLAEFGLTIPPEREIQIWDSSAELRYMVLPIAPAGVAQLDEDTLARQIPREALIGVAEVRLTDPVR